MPDMVLSHKSTSVASHVQYENKTHEYGPRCSPAATWSEGRLARHDESCRSGDEQVGATAVVADEGAASLASSCGPCCQTPRRDAG